MRYSCLTDVRSAHSALRVCACVRVCALSGYLNFRFSIFHERLSIGWVVGWQRVRIWKIVDNICTCYTYAMDAQTYYAYQRIQADITYIHVEVCVSALKMLTAVIHCLCWYVFHVRIRTHFRVFAAYEVAFVCVRRGILFFCNFEIQYIRGNMSGNML